MPCLDLTKQIKPNHAIPMATTYKIETLTSEGWTDDASLLGAGCTQADNTWPSKEAALAAIAELESVGFNPAELRVAADA